MKPLPYLIRWLAQGVLVGEMVLLSKLPGLAQVVPDTTLPNPSRVPAGCINCPIEGGTVRGVDRNNRFLPVGTNNRFIYAGRDYEFNFNNLNNELWVALAEKAYAQLNQSGWIGQNNTNSDTGIDAGWSAPVLRHITGAKSYSQSVSSMNRNQLITLVNAPTPITAGFVNSAGFGVIDRHGYTITSYNSTT
jgi:hypothetical protein